MKTDRRQKISEHSDEIMLQNSQPDDITAQQVPGDENWDTDRKWAWEVNPYHKQKTQCYIAQRDIAILQMNNNNFKSKILFHLR